MFRGQIANIQDNQNKMVALQAKIRAEIYDLEQKFNKYFTAKAKGRFPGLDIYWLQFMQGGCMTNSWEASTYLMTFNGYTYYRKTNQWYRKDNHGQITFYEPPVDMGQLEQFMEEVYVETGVVVKLYDTQEPKSDAPDEWADNEE